MWKIDMKRIGAFYREKVLSLPKESLIKKELPTYSDDLKIEQNLFECSLFTGREYMKCRSEEEARFIKVFLSVRMNEIYVPIDDEYLKSILPELERLKSRTDEIINSYLESVFDRKIREKVRQEVYAEITQ